MVEIFFVGGVGVVRGFFLGAHRRLLRRRGWRRRRGYSRLIRRRWPRAAARLLRRRARTTSSEAAVLRRGRGGRGGEIHQPQRGSGEDTSGNCFFFGDGATARLLRPQVRHRTLQNAAPSLVAGRKDGGGGGGRGRLHPWQRRGPPGGEGFFGHRSRDNIHRYMLRLTLIRGILCLIKVLVPTYKLCVEIY